MSIANELNLSIGAEIDGLQKGLDQAGKELTKFEKKVQGLSKIGGQMQKIGGAMTIGISAPLIAIGTLATKAFAELEGVKTAFERLNDATLLDDLRKATKGTVSDFVLMKSAVRAENFEIPVKKLGTLLEFARRRAKDTGESVDYLVNSLVDGIGRKSTMILDNLGISATALSKELKGVGVASLSVGEVSEAVERIAKRSLDGMGKDVLTLTEQWLQVKTTIANSMTEIGAIIAPMLKPVIELVKSLADKFKNLSPEAKKLIVIFGGIAIAIGPVVAILGTVLVLLPSIIAGVGALGTAFTALMGPIGLVIAGIGAIIYAVVKNWDSIKPYIIGTINYFIELYNESENVRMAIQGLVLSFKIGFSAIKNIVSTAWEVFKSFAKATADIFGGIGTIIKGVFNRNFDEIKQGAADVSKAYLTGFKDIGKDIDTGIGSLFADIKKNTDKAVENLKKNKIPLITELFSSDPADIQAAKDNVNDDINEVINGVGIGGRQNVIPLNIEIAPSGIEKSKEGIKEFFDGIKRTYFTEGEIAAAEMKITNERISRGVSNIISRGAVDSISDASAAIGNALASGNDVLESVGKSLLSSLGGILVDLGKMSIQIGVGLIAVELGLKSLNPAVAIAAGVALVALGSFFSSKTKSIGNSMGGGGGSSTGSAGGGSYSTPRSNTQSSGGFGGGTVVFEIEGQKLVGVLSRTLDRNQRLASDIGL